MRKGLLAPQNTFLDTIAERFDGSRKFFGMGHWFFEIYSFQNNFEKNFEIFVLG